MSLRFQKSLAGTLILSSALSLVALISYSYPQPVEAQSGGCSSVVAGVLASFVGVEAATKVTGVPVSALAVEGISASSAGSNYAQFFETCVLKPLAIDMAQRVLANITNSLVTWIQSGFNGNPAFVTNIDDLVSNSANQAIGQFINSTDLKFLCQPFSLQVRLALATSFSSQQYAGCTLSQVDQNLSNLGASQQAWQSWLNVSTVPANNQYGAYVQLSSQLSSQLNQQVQNLNNEINRNGGFLDYKVCDTPAGADPNSTACTHSYTVTPGATISNALSAKYGAEYNQIGLASDIDQIMGALVNEMVSKTITGPGGLLGGSTQNVSSSANISTVVSQTQSGSDLVNTYNSQVNNTTNDLNTSINAVNTTTGPSQSIQFTGTPASTTIAISRSGNVAGTYSLSISPSATVSTPISAVITLTSASAKGNTTFNAGGYSLMQVVNGVSANIDPTASLLSTGALTVNNMPAPVDLDITLPPSSNAIAGASYAYTVTVTDSTGAPIGTNTETFVITP